MLKHFHGECEQRNFLGKKIRRKFSGKISDALSVIPPAVLRNLSDKLYEKRKNAGLEIEGIVKQLASAGEHDKITAVINLLANEFTYSAQVNRRKGGLIGLATATVALTGEAAQHLEMDRARSDGDYRE
ncbi:hypothetical protein LOK49_LG03G02711 [Camellia lanceoleosa]|uniref:Uncharacterized protein n=1 Tax=Camellia lanceoleosa TaxID=1840588 RepID=A0ACC0IEN5_9ERIC|nr:hypothetical protein LOK49_LG03G02711 [Camellia lanceoleosa]